MNLDKMVEDDDMGITDKIVSMTDRLRPIEKPNTDKCWPIGERRRGTTPLRGQPLDDNGAIEFQPFSSMSVLSIYEKALRSIAANSCCDKCQEAKLVAQAALDAAEPPLDVTALEGTK